MHYIHHIMKKISLICILLVAISGFKASGQRLLPVTVQQFLDEQSFSDNFKSMQRANGERSRFVSPRSVDGIPMIDAFIAIDGEQTLSMLQNAGVVINSMFDGFVTAQIPVEALTHVCRIPGVKDVEISYRLDLCTDSTLSVTHTNMVHNGLSYGLPASYDGSGVIVGVIDNGFDFQHRAFKSNEDPTKNRIVRVYNTTDKTGHKALYNQIIRLPGSVFMGTQINRLTTDNSSSTHGTHTTGIAAGSHVGPYGGMAPGADIVLCAASVLDGSMSAVEVANCVRYIDSYADSVGQPCVMSLSVSTPNGQHDGQDYLSRVVNQISGPGRIFVISAGNDAGRNSYAHHAASPSSPLNLLFTCKNSLGGDSTYYYGGVISDIWMRESNVNYYYKFHVLNMITGKILWESEVFSKKTKIDVSAFANYYKCHTADTVGYIEATTSYASDGKKYRLDVYLHNLITNSYYTMNGVKKSRYGIGVTVYPRKDVTCEIDAWACNTGTRFGTYHGSVTQMDGELVRGFYAGSSDSCCIGTYCTGDSTISAGAYSARNSYYSMNQNKIITDNTVTVGDIASFSSYQIAGAGPTGEALPTVCAPGTLVASAVSRYSPFARGSSGTVMKVDGSYWGVLSGTSMAAPTVAGIIALWLEANPNLSVADIKEIIAETSIQDSFTNGLNREHFGPNGKIDAYAGLQYLLHKNVPQKGDVDGDGFVNIGDITQLIYYLLNGEPAGMFYTSAADFDDDGRINIADITQLIDYVINA